MLKHCCIRSKSLNLLQRFRISQGSGATVPPTHTRMNMIQKNSHWARARVIRSLSPNLALMYVFFQMMSQESMTSTPVNRPPGEGDVTPRRKCSVPLEPMRTPTLTLASPVIFLKFAFEYGTGQNIYMVSILSLHLKLTFTPTSKVHTTFILIM